MKILGSRRLDPGGRKSPEESRSDIVRMAFHARRNIENVIRGNSGGGVIYQSSGQNQARDDRGSRGPQTTALGNRILAADQQTRGGNPHGGECFHCGSSDKMTFIARQIVGTLALNIYANTGIIRDNRDHMIVKPQGKPERVKTRAQIRTRGRYLNFYSRRPQQVCTHLLGM
jgi:hypothetical protein